MIALHWFRRDLRLEGNFAFSQAFKKSNGNICGIFIFDSTFLSRADFSANRFHFFLMSLVELKKSLRLIGSDLLIFDEGPSITWEKIFEKSSKKEIEIFANEDYEPFAIERDKKIKLLIENKGSHIHFFKDHLVIHPNDLHKSDLELSGYQVYTPFAKKWREIFKKKLLVFGEDNLKKTLKFNYGSNQGKITWDYYENYKNQTDKILNQFFAENNKNKTLPDSIYPIAGFIAARQCCEEFKKNIENYEIDRDIPSLSGTSQLSIYLKNGSITTLQVIAILDLFNLAHLPKLKSSCDKFLSELIWREFYYHIIFRNQRVENESFLLKFKELKWQNNEKFFEAWKNGMTGFPVIDAGMRQLNQTGWMHNRVRMIVASFLTKDLLINWQWGERYFMKMLLDGDLASNNGGWQWAASTGCDPQPYFRIFNPWLQSKRFDPNGIYIKKFIPELKDVADAELHKPQSTRLGNYPLPIVDHDVQRLKALDLYKSN